MHGVIRRYSNASALADGLASNEQEVRELLTTVPGFHHYSAIRAGDTVVTVTVCDDAAGTAESSRRARNWVQQNLAGTNVGTPEITEGEVILDFEH